MLSIAGGNAALFFDPMTGAFGSRNLDLGSLRLPGYTIANLSGGVHWDNGLDVSVYVNNLFDANPKLSIDRERGLRARFGYLIGQPRTIGMTVRMHFAARKRLCCRRLPRPASSAAASGNPDLPDGSVILASDACPAPPPPPPPPPPAPERG